MADDVVSTVAAEPDAVSQDASAAVAVGRAKAFEMGIEPELAPAATTSDVMYSVVSLGGDVAACEGQFTRTVTPGTKATRTMAVPTGEGRSIEAAASEQSSAKLAIVESLKAKLAALTTQCQSVGWEYEALGVTYAGPEAQVAKDNGEAAELKAAKVAIAATREDLEAATARADADTAKLAARDAARKKGDADVAAV